MSGIAEFTPEFFDEASRAWRLNKLVKPEGTFRYKRNAFSKPKEHAVRPVKKVPLRRSVRLLRKEQKKRATK